MKHISFVLFLVIFSTVFLHYVAFADIQNEINIKQQQINALEKQIQEYQTKIDQNRGLSKTLSSEVAKLNYEIQKIQLEVKNLSLIIDSTTLNIEQTNDKIVTAEDGVIKLKSAIAEFIRFTQIQDQISLLEILLKNNQLSDYFNNADAIESAHQKAKINIQQLKELKTALESEREELEIQKGEHLRLRQIQEIQRQSLASTKNQKDSILKETQGQETKFQKLIQTSKKDIERIRSQIGFLIQQGVTVEEAIKFGQLAAIRVGIRPAFLIAILEIESGLGRNVGTGNWVDDMYNCYLRLGRRDRAEAEKAAILQIINELSLDASTLRVSREPYYGCGGAMGPAQFLPTTWLGYKEEVARLTGHNPPNPWKIEDAFMAAAAKLARGGATSQERTGETRAAKAYVSGSPTCTKPICNSYARAVLQKAAEIEQNLD